MFPYGYAKNLKENYPEIWRRGGNGGNPPTSFTGNDAFRNWTKYQSGDRSESVLNWVRRREIKEYESDNTGHRRLTRKTTTNTVFLYEIKKKFFVIRPNIISYICLLYTSPSPRDS